MPRLMTWGVLIACLLTGCAGKTARPPSAMHAHVATSSLGDLHHPVSTKNAEAQRAFDEGLTLVYAFNHDEAIHSFQKALASDPNLAMAHWGIALALGPNYNVDVNAEREQKAFIEIQKAKELAGDASQPERDFIDALAKRYSDDPKADLKKLGVDYSNAMRELMKKYPDDLDAATLFADSAMVLRPWHLWSHDGKPAEGTLELVAALESVLKRDPDHIGANHLYIHAVEASPQPERALDAAARLGGLAPSAGHLVHMPSHVYSRVGDYEAAAGSNEAAVATDEEYIREKKPQGVYPMMYYSHNLHFLAFAQSMQGRFADAKKAADTLADHVGPHLAHMPMLEGFMPTPELVLLRFHKWDEILNVKQPEASMPVTTSMWHFARGVAFARTGRIDDAAKERDAMLAINKSFPADAMYSPLNKMSDVAKVAQQVLDAQIALAKKDRKTAADLLAAAAKDADALNYMEPPDWWLPPRESLGGIMLQEKNFTEAEKVFRAELEKNPRSGRALFGLMKSLEGEGKNYDAQSVKAQFDTSWKNADVKLKVEDL